jgi:hypothetical protein
MKPIFILPKTSLCVVIWYRNNEKHETLIDTPHNSANLIDVMLMNHHVGYSEIRGIKSVDTKELLNGFRRRQF